MDTAQVVVTVLGAGGGGAVLLAMINGLVKWLSGSSGRERERNTNLISQRRSAIEERDEAERERDEADKKRRITDEYASSLRRQLIENGLTPGEWPLDKTIVTNQEKKENDVPGKPYTNPIRAP